MLGAPMVLCCDKARRQMRWLSGSEAHGYRFWLLGGVKVCNTSRIDNQRVLCFAGGKADCVRLDSHDCILRCLTPFESQG